MELLLMLNCRNLSYGLVFFFHRSATKIVYNPDTTNDDPWTLLQRDLLNTCGQLYIITWFIQYVCKNITTTMTCCKKIEENCKECYESDLEWYSQRNSPIWTDGPLIQQVHCLQWKHVTIVFFWLSSALD